MASASTVCRRLRDTAIAYSLSALRLFARLPVATPPVPGIGLTDTSSAHAALDAAAGLIVAVVAYRLTRLPVHPPRS